MYNNEELENGVIGINRNGNMIKIAINKEILSSTKKSPHATATISVARKLGAHIEDASMPYEAGLNALYAGILIIQVLPEDCFGYIPKNLSQNQLSKLYYEIKENANHTFHYDNT